MNTLAEELLQAYRQTIYWCESPEQSIAIRIGQTHPLLDAALQQESVTQWAYITAHNPFSTPRTPQQNRAMNEQLASEVASQGYKYWHGTGIDPAGQWPPEASFLVPGMDRDTASDWGRKYEQNAIVVGRLGDTAELLCLTASPGCP